MNKYIADYLRLSQDDKTIGESNSITSQRQIIENYIATVSEFAGLSVTEFVDDGYSGTNFDRPAVRRLLEAVRKGEVSCIIVKDFSRFGRQYLEVSKFIEQIFPYLDVRFIAVNDHYDSNNHKGTTADIDVPVRNMINAMYSKDISKKVKSAKRIQFEKGVFSNAFAPYGYKKDESDRHRLLIDEPAAEIVRRIFTLAGEGRSAFQIADRLNADGVLNPAMYKRNNGSKLAVSDTTRAIWTNGIISNILCDERYTGTLVGGRKETIAVGSGKKRKKPKNEWIRVPDVLPAIITPEIFNDLAAKRRRFGTPAKPNTDRILYKKVRCGYCNHILKYIGDSSKPYYLCDTARYTDHYGCERKRFLEQQIIDAVRAVVQSRLSVMLDMGKLMREGKKAVKQGLESAQVTATRLEGEIKQLQTYKRRLYERYKIGSLEKDAFMGERESIETKISTKTAEHDALIVGNDEQSDALDSAQQFLNSFSKYQAMPILRDEAINELVEVVYVFDTDRMEVKLSFHDELEKTIEALKRMA